MRGWVAWMLAVWVAPCVWGQTSVTVPWEDVKRLHEESVERKIMEKLNRATAARKPQVYSVEETRCQLKIGPREAQGRLLISGRVIEGDPEPIRLFGPGTVVAGIAGVRGGTLLPARAGGDGLAFLPTNSGPFQVELDVVLPVREDATSRLVEADWPPAVLATVALAFEAGLQMLDPPGYEGATPGTYRLPGQGRVCVRFADAARGEKPRIVELDLFTGVRFQENKAVLRTWFLPVRVEAASVEVLAPAGARLLGSSLPDSRIRAASNGVWVVESADLGRSPFSMEFILPDDPVAGVAFAMPSVSENRGREGYFAVEEPQDGEVELRADGVQEKIPLAKLAPALLREAGLIRSLAHAPRGQAVRLLCRPYAPVARPAVVLEAIDFAVTFEESGATMVLLSATVPPEAGTRLFLRAVPGTEVWSLKVDGAGRSVYGDGQGRWVVPLADGKPSRVELALLHKGEKLGLKGRAEAALPETGLSAQVARVRLSLPARVDLLSVEGAVSPDAAAAGDGSGGGRRTYGFVRPFYKGEAMPIAALYKEPVKAAKGSGNQ